MRQNIKCNVCGSEFKSWFDFVSHYLEEHAFDLINSERVVIDYDEPALSSVVKRMRVKYNISKVSFRPYPYDKVGIDVETIKANDIGMLKDIVKGIEDFAYAVDGQIEEIGQFVMFDKESIIPESKGVVIRAVIVTGVDSWNEFVSRILG